MWSSFFYVSQSYVEIQTNLGWRHPYQIYTVVWIVFFLIYRTYFKSSFLCFVKFSENLVYLFRSFTVVSDGFGRPHSSLTDLIPLSNKKVYAEILHQTIILTETYRIIIRSLFTINNIWQLRLFDKSPLFVILYRRSSQNRDYNNEKRIISRRTILRVQLTTKTTRGFQFITCSSKSVTL